MLDLASGAAKRSKSSKKGKRPVSSSNTPKHPRLLRDEGKVLLFLYLGKGWYCIACILQSTVEPRLTTTPLIRPPRYCDHFFMPRTKAHSFSYLKIPLIRPPRYYDHRPPLGVLSRYFLYKITPLIRPVKILGGAAE